MKTLLKLTSGIALALVITVTACQKEKTASVEVAKEKVSLTNLVQKLNTSTDLSGFKTAYASLNAEELQQFEEIRLKNDSVNLIRKAAEGSNGRISTSQETQISAELRRAKDIRSGVYTASLSKFNKPFNKLSDEETNELFNSLERKSDFTIAACPTASYPSIAYYRNYAGTNYYGIWDMGSTGSTDCDYEYRFDGYYYYAAARNVASQNLLNSFGSAVSRRLIYYTDGYDTALLLGAVRVWFWVGPPSYVALHMVN